MKHVAFPSLGIELDINPIAISFPFGLKIHWYGIIIALGMVLAALLVYREIKKSGRDGEMLFDFLIFAIPLSVIGARCYYVIFSWDSYKDNLPEIFAVWHGGLAIYGGVIVGVLCAAVFAKVKHIPFLWFADIASAGCILAQSIGRWGNFVNGEAFGGETNLPWRMVIDYSDKAVHPTFLYESLWNFAGFLISYFLIYRRKHTDGASLAFYLVWYGTGRFFIEALRSDSLYIGGIKVSQLVALASVVLGIFLAVFIKIRAKKAN